MDAGRRDGTDGVSDETVARMVERAPELVAGMEQARSILGLGYAPDPAWAAALTARAAAAGMSLTFRQEIDGDGRIRHEAHIDTGRGVIKRTPAARETWEATLADVIGWLG